MKTGSPKKSPDPKALFWPLQISGWIAGGFVLFLAGLSHQPLLPSAIRNSLFAVIGFVLSLILYRVYKKLWQRYHSFWVNGAAAFLGSYLCGVISGFILNPISFHFFHGGLGPDPFSALFAGVLNFALVFVVWSACYYAVKYYLDPTGSRPAQNDYLQRLSVEHGKELIPLKMQEISHIKAESDYIKIFVNDRAYLLRKTLRHLERQLDPLVFQRVHRSYIVNINFVASLRPHTNGEYFIILSTGARLKLSRSYRHVLKSHFGSGA